VVVEIQLRLGQSRPITLGLEVEIRGRAAPGDLQGWPITQAWKPRKRMFGLME
jgi:hypothetical protein